MSKWKICRVEIQKKIEARTSSFSMNLTENVLTKLKRDLKVNQKEAVKFITDCFD